MTLDISKDDVVKVLMGSADHSMSIKNITWKAFPHERNYGSYARQDSNVNRAQYQVRKIIEELFKDGMVSRSGLGRGGKPHRYAWITDKEREEEEARQAMRAARRRREDEFATHLTELMGLFPGVEVKDGQFKCERRKNGKGLTNFWYTVSVTERYQNDKNEEGGNE